MVDGRNLRREYGDDVVARALALRATGLSLDATVARLAEEMAPRRSPSKGWLQQLEAKRAAAASRAAAERARAEADGQGQGTEPVPSLEALETPAAEQHETIGALSRADLRVRVARTVSVLERRIAALPPGTAGATEIRLLIASLQSAAKLAEPEREDEADVTRVRTAEIDAAAARAREGLRQQLENVLRQREDWERCPHCGQRMKPQGEAEKGK